MQGENQKNFINNLPRLQWACRRGMLELDVLLGNFLKKGYQPISTEQKEKFVELLSYPDPLLFAWLIKAETPTDQSFAQLIEIIRQYARI